MIQNIKFSEQHQKVSEELLTISPLESAVTVTTNLAFAQVLSNIQTEALLKHLTPKLETIAQHREKQKQEVCYALVLSLCHAFIFSCIYLISLTMCTTGLLFCFYWTYFGLSHYLNT